MFLGGIKYFIFCLAVFLFLNYEKYRGYPRETFHLVEYYRKLSSEYRFVNRIRYCIFFFKQIPHQNYHENSVPHKENVAWILNADQMTFMLQHHNAIETAYAANDIDFLRELAKSDAYRKLFGEMGWDEAYDRYETMLEDEE